MDVRRKGSAAGKKKSDSTSDQTSHLPEDKGVEDRRAHADSAVVRLVPVEEVHQFPMNEY